MYLLHLNNKPENNTLLFHAITFCFQFFIFLYFLDLVSTIYSSVRRHSQDWRNNQSCKEGNGFCKQNNSICQRWNSLLPSHSFSSDLLQQLSQATQPLSSPAVLWKALFYPKIKAVAHVAHNNFQSLFYHKAFLFIPMQYSLQSSWRIKSSLLWKCWVWFLMILFECQKNYHLKFKIKGKGKKFLREESLLV